MKLAFRTEMGEFKFNLSQTSVIYLLGLAQELEDEGDKERSSAQEQGSNITSPERVKHILATTPGLYCSR